MFRSARIPVTLGLAILDGPPAAVAYHVQDSDMAPPNGFVHKGGNERWVEVGPVQPVRMRAQVEGGPRVDLSLRSRGHWAGPFLIEPGHKVHFRTFFTEDNTEYESCWFTHPTGRSPEGAQIRQPTQATVP